MEPNKRKPKGNSHNGGKREPKTLGPVPDLEAYVPPDWWRRIFNANYLKTDSDVVDDGKLTRQEVDLIVGYLGLDRDDRILDVCCGQGRHSLELARRGFHRVEGLDRSHYLIQRAKATARKEALPVRFREGDARKLPFSDDEFDAVMILGNSFGYFETVEDDLRVLREIFRLLVPSGKLMIDVADGDYVRSAFQPRAWEWIDRRHFVCRERSLSADGQRLISREIISHADKGVVVDQFYAERLYSRESLSALMRAAGFSDVTIHQEIATQSQRNQDLGMMAQRLLVSGQARKAWTPKPSKMRAASKQVAVVMGDPRKPDLVKPDTTFDEDDFYTIDQLKAALHKLDDYSFNYLDNHDTLLQDLRELRGKVELVLNLCDEGLANDPRQELHVPAILELLGLAYTGAGPQCLAYCYDKSLVRGVAQEMGVPVPAAFFVQPEATSYKLPFPFPVIVKPNFGDSSFGITQRSVASTVEELLNAISEIRETFGYDKPVIVEEFLTGMDLSVGIIGNPPGDYQVLPIVEEDYSVLPPDLPRICGYEAKWLPDSPYWSLRSIPADLPPATHTLIVEACARLFERLECRDYARFDWRLDADGNPRLLEVNPNPGWCWDGHLAKMAAIQSMTYADVLAAILHAAEQRVTLAQGTSQARSRATAQAAPAPA